MDSDDERDDFFGNNDFDDGVAIGDDEAVEVPSGSQKKEEKITRKRIVRNPQPKLNEDTLTGPKGIRNLLDIFKNYKPNKKLDYYQNLDIMMKKYENWSHVMYPRIKFDDVIAKCERLGSKARVKNYMSMMRMNMSLDDNVVEEKANSSKKNDIVTTDNNEDELNDKFDMLPKQKKNIFPSQKITNTIGVITSRSDDEDEDEEVLLNMATTSTSEDVRPVTTTNIADDEMGFDPEEDARRQFELEADSMMTDFDY